MKIISRYVVKEYIAPFFGALFVVLFVLILDYILKMLKLIIQKGVDPAVVLKFFGLSLAWMVILASPMAILVATMMVFGKMSEDGEIIALKALGYPFYKLILPPLLVCSLLTVSLFIFNDLVLPEANHEARMLISDIKRKKPSIFLKEGVVIDEFPGIKMMVNKIDFKTSELNEITIFDEEGRNFPRIITADSGIMNYSEEEDAVTFKLYNGEIHEVDEEDPALYTKTVFEEQIIRIQELGVKLEHKESGRRGDREMRTEQMKELIDERKDRIESTQDKMVLVVENAIDFVLNPHDNKPPPSNKSAAEKAYSRNKNIYLQLKSRNNVILGAQSRINKLLVEIHKKFSIPFACLVFLLLGAPVGVMGRKGGIAAATGLSIGFFLIYWAFLIGGEELADRGIISPFFGMWNGNILLTLLGLYLIYWTTQEVHFIDWEKLRFWKKVKEEKRK
ncbi:LptF/LptG family permease [bacterium]|nr:LptF/LptG family permease [bacterium]